MAAYQLYDLPVHFSNAVLSADGSSTFNDTQTWTFHMMNSSLHKYLRTQVCFFLSKNLWRDGFICMSDLKAKKLIVWFLFEVFI